MAAAKELLGAYLIIGEDKLKRQDMLKAMEKRISALGELELNMNVFSAAEVEAPEDVLSACVTVPFLCDKRLVVVKGIEAAKKSLLDSLKAYLEDPFDSTVLIVEGDKLAANTGLYKTFDKSSKAMIISCDPKSAKDGLEDTVCKLAAKYGARMGKFEAGRLINMIGNSTIAIDSEVKKLADYVIGQGKDIITEDDIRELVVRTELPKPWDIADAMAARDAKRCSHYLALIPQDSYMAVMSMCSKRIRELMLVKGNSLCQGCAKPLGMLLGGPDWKYKNHNRWANGFEFEELTEAMGSAAECEQAMKSGTDQLQALQVWILGVCSRD